MIFFCDNPPLKEKGFGLSVLNYNQLLGLGSRIKLVLTFRGQNGLTKNDILGDAAWPTLLCDDALARWAERQLSGKVRYSVETLGFLLSLPKIMAIAKRESNSPLFIPVGASASFLWRVLLLQVLCKNPSYIYFVDDIEQINTRLGNKFEMQCAKWFLPRVIKNADRIFVISEGLGKAYSQRYGVPSQVILPCFPVISPSEKKVSEAESPFTFVFSGGLSFLYNDTLLLFQNAIREFNLSNPKNACRLIIQTYSDYTQFLTLGFDESLVEYRTSEKRGSFTSYLEADCFLVPYSFNPAMKIMVTTSFPQKVAELLQLGRPILFFGPVYSSVIAFFKRIDVPYIVDSPTSHLLQKSLSELTTGMGYPTLLETYSRIHSESFSPEATATLMLAEVFAPAEPA